VTQGQPLNAHQSKYFPFGECLESPPYPTDILFTGQRLDDTGLYYYGARYYDAGMGRFISPDTIVPDPANPQSFNRYSYCLNNPLKYLDPSGHVVYIKGYDVESLYNSMENFFYGMPNQGIIDAIISPEFQAYNTFRSDYSAVAGVFESSDLKYNAYSETAKVDDLYITNSQRIQDNFTMLIPAGVGEVNYSIDTTWHQGSVTISISTSIRVLWPETSYGFSSAKLNGTTEYIPLKDPGYPRYSLPNTDYRCGTLKIDNGFPESKIQLDLYVSAVTNSSDPSDYNRHLLITPSSWHILIWEGLKPKK
jgi:RHS repeat-associated protein